MAVVKKEFLSIKDIADICNTNSSTVSNWRNRDKDNFPAPYQVTSGTPLWKVEDINDYLKKKYDDEWDLVLANNLSKKTIAIVGRAKGGKSFFVSRLVRDKIGFIRLFSSNGDDKTACPIYVEISESIEIEMYEFHSDFNSIYTSEDEGEDIQKVRARVSELTGCTYHQNDVDKMRLIEDTVWMMREVEKRFEGRRNSATYITTKQKPSDFAKRILRKNSLGTLEIIDTPGKSGRVDAPVIEKSDLYFFLIKSDNSDEAKSIKDIVTTLKADIATSKVAFLYKKEGFLLTEKKYNEARESVKSDMKVFNDLFEDIRTNIISTDLDVCDPASHCIVYPTMDEEEITYPEEQFLKDIEKKMDDAFSPDTEEKLRNEFIDEVNLIGEEAKAFVLNILRGVPQHEFGKKGTKYTVEDVINGRHDRVMTNDGYKFASSLGRAYQVESTLLEKYFSDFKIEDYPEEWKQVVIKYLYRTLSTSVRNDRGLGVGTHPFEKKPARTMLVEESILADRVLSAIENADKMKSNTLYRQALIDSNITSETWGYAACNDDEDAKIKLELIKDSLFSKSVSTRDEMVLCRYVGGLRKIAEYEILLDIGYTPDEAHAMTINLPF